MKDEKDEKLEKVSHGYYFNITCMHAWHTINVLLDTVFTLVSKDKMSHIICIYNKFGVTGFLK